jgi:hypothetical protein
MAGTGVSRSVPQYKPEILQPYDWKSNPFYGALQGQTWDQKSPDMMGQFMDKFNPMYDYFMGGMKGIDTGAGLGQYDSDLLNQLAGKVSGNLADPKSGQAYGLTMDRIQGQGNAARQNLADEFAGWGRGSGVRSNAQSALENSLRKERADAGRQTAMEADRNAMKDSFDLEGMRGGFFENSKQRELGNAGLNRDLLMGMQSGGMGMMGSLADMLKAQSGQDTAAYAANQGFKNTQAQNMFNLYGSNEPAYRQAQNTYKNQTGQQNWTQQMFPQYYGDRMGGGTPQFGAPQKKGYSQNRGYI